MTPTLDSHDGLAQRVLHLEMELKTLKSQTRAGAAPSVPDNNAVILNAVKQLSTRVEKLEKGNVA